MNFLNLEYFLIVAEEQSISRAAERVHLTQQALSGQILRLEEEMGCPLFKRKPSFALTYAGECFREQARQMLNLKLETESMLEDIRANKKGVLRIGISYSRGQVILPMVLPAYSASHPQVDISIREDVPQNLVTGVTQGTLDVIVDFLPFHSAVLDARPLFNEHLFLVASKALLREQFGDQAENVLNAFAATEDLALLEQAPFILLRKGEHIRAMLDNEFRRQKVTPNIRLETSNAQTALSMAAEGMGITIVHEIFLMSGFMLGALALPSEREKMAILPFKRTSLVDTVGIGYHKDRYISSITRDFIELCEQKLHSFGFRRKD